MSTNTNTALAEIKRNITAQTVEMDTNTYCWLLRELAEWYQDQANMQEYAEDFAEDYNE